MVQKQKLLEKTTNQKKKREKNKQNWPNVRQIECMAEEE